MSQEHLRRADLRRDEADAPCESRVLRQRERLEPAGDEIAVALDPDRGKRRRARRERESDGADARAEIDRQAIRVGRDERLQERGVEAGAMTRRAAAPA